MTIYPGAITYWNAISGDDIVPTLIGRVHVTGIPWEQWCPLSYSCHLCGKELRGTPRGIWIYQVFQQSRLNLPNFCGLLPAGESWGADMRQPAWGCTEVHIKSEANDFHQLHECVVIGKWSFWLKPQFPHLQRSLVMLSCLPLRVVWKIKEDCREVCRVVERAQTLKVFRFKSLFYDPLTVWLCQVS